MAAQNEVGKFGQVHSAAITDIVATGNDGYFLKVSNVGSQYSFMGFSLYSSGLTAAGADSVLWMQAWALNHSMNIAANIDDAANKGAIGINTKLQAAVIDYDGWEFVTSGGAGSITVNTVVSLIANGYAVTGSCLVPGIALMLRANTGVDSWTAGTLEIMPFGIR